MLHRRDCRGHHFFVGVKFAVRRRHAYSPRENLSLLEADSKYSQTDSVVRDV